jgi:hypothetical protein
MFSPKDLRPSEIMALRTLIEGRMGNVPQTLEGIVESACLWACQSAGFLQGKGQTVDWSRLSEAVRGCFSMVFFA